MKRVITYGSFDLFHEGHYKLLKRAKELGDYLIVGVTTEQYDETRGKLNLVDSLFERIENVKKLVSQMKLLLKTTWGKKQKIFKNIKQIFLQQVLIGKANLNTLEIIAMLFICQERKTSVPPNFAKAVIQL